ncbi:MAG: zinc-ribbon domain-containing protein [Butyrivibrio sp.]|nr:zinc-ribbon domain-containing protein [Butyrivibrio sp.]
MGICNRCGNAIPDGTVFCPNCGNKIEAASYVAGNNASYTGGYQQTQSAGQMNYDQQIQQPQYYQNAAMGPQPVDQGMQAAYGQPAGSFGNGYNAGPYAQYNQQFQQPDLNEPMTFMDWFKTLLLLLIPVANIILLIMWGFFTKDKKSKVSFARACLAMLPILFILYFIVSLITALTL